MLGVIVNPMFPLILKALLGLRIQRVYVTRREESLVKSLSSVSESLTFVCGVGRRPRSLNGSDFESRGE